MTSEVQFCYVDFAGANVVNMTPQREEVVNMFFSQCKGHFKRRQIKILRLNLIGSWLRVKDPCLLEGGGLYLASLVGNRSLAVYL